MKNKTNRLLLYCLTFGLSVFVLFHHTVLYFTEGASNFNRLLMVYGLFASSFSYVGILFNIKGVDDKDAD
ncbi:hypothetical protein [Aureibacillus halotolerans]|uniref:Uncharacterized protein n=1 Tax=Aureibacillus halotolerans TaxID=1508390 RepID=A0A4R6U829_9BACI|nr:hypothetical protein [Aureibacillus halotolerans]TDQ39214.1 hypothetical protein EV213_108166 [Aureibacillus halotolerans]